MIPKEALEYLGRMDPPEVMEVEKGSIRRYADAVGNDNPLYSDEEHVRAITASGSLGNEMPRASPVRTVRPAGGETEGLEFRGEGLRHLTR